MAVSAEVFDATDPTNPGPISLQDGFSFEPTQEGNDFVRVDVNPPTDNIVRAEAIAQMNASVDSQSDRITINSNFFFESLAELDQGVNTDPATQQDIYAEASVVFRQRIEFLVPFDQRVRLTTSGSESSTSFSEPANRANNTPGELANGSSAAVNIVAQGSNGFEQNSLLAGTGWEFFVEGSNDFSPTEAVSELDNGFYEIWIDGEVSSRANVGGFPRTAIGNVFADFQILLEIETLTDDLTAGENQAAVVQGAAGNGPGNVRATFDQVTTGGKLTATYDGDLTPEEFASGVGQPLPGGFVLGDEDDSVLWEVSFDGEFEESITLQLEFDPDEFDVPARGLQLWHFTGGRWVLESFSQIAPGRIELEVDSFSPFLLTDAIIPEPGTLGLLGGLLALGIRRPRPGA
ncbi:MAG: hypothetical protein AAF800_14480 [Planctomycetota bacterium]